MNWKDEPCAFEGCTNLTEVKTSGLCRTHNAQKTSGRPLTPIGSTKGQHNKYPEDAKCLFEGCTLKVKANDKCQSHDWQMRKHGHMYEIKSKGGSSKKKMNGGYSEDMTCDTCRQTKNWKLFVLGMEGNDSMCRDCHRKQLSRMVHEGTASHHSASNKKTTLSDVLEFIQARTGA